MLLRTNALAVYTVPSQKVMLDRKVMSNAMFTPCARNARAYLESPSECLIPTSFLSVRELALQKCKSCPMSKTRLIKIYNIKGQVTEVNDYKVYNHRNIVDEEIELQIIFLLI